MNHKKIYILSGPVQSGKTTHLLKWIQNRNDVSGILTPVIKSKRIFLDIKTKEEFLMEALPNETELLKVGKYVFSLASFKRANKILKKTIEEKSGWIIVDEIGPLELQGKGFAEIIKQMLNHQGNKQNLLFVIRENILDDVLDYFKIKKPATFLLYLNK